MDLEMKQKLGAWANKFALNLKASPEEDKLSWALNPDLDIKQLSLDDVSELLFVLASFHYSLAAEMGRVYAVMRQSNDDLARAKLNIIKPHHDSLELKISVVKKIFDRKCNEHRRDS